MTVGARREAPFWTDEQGQPLTCTEKLRNLREGEAELRDMMQETYDDALLLGVDPTVVRTRFVALIETLESSFHLKKTKNAPLEDPS